jgi:hypothetical protein
LEVKTVDDEFFSKSGIIAIIVFLVLKESFGLVRWAIDRKKNGKNGSRSCDMPLIVSRIDSTLGILMNKVAELSPKMSDLHTWHDKEDGDGVKIWYVRQSLEKAIAKLIETIQDQSKLMERLVTRLETVEQVVHHVEENVKDCPKK